MESSRRADLSNADLRGVYLPEADLSYADPGGANLQRVDLDRADLQGARLLRADLRGGEQKAQILSIRRCFGVRMTPSMATTGTFEMTICPISKWFAHRTTKQHCRAACREFLLAGRTLLDVHIRMVTTPLLSPHDGLTAIRDIAPSLAARPEEADATSYAQLAALSPEELTAYARRPALLIESEEWIDQARGLTSEKQITGEAPRERQARAFGPLRHHYCSLGNATYRSQVRRRR